MNPDNDKELIDAMYHKLCFELEKLRTKHAELQTLAEEKGTSEAIDEAIVALARLEEAKRRQSEFVKKYYLK